MQFLNIEQKSTEWWDLKVGKISGTRFGQATSTRKNSLIYELIGENLQGYIEVSEFVNEDMQYGIDNEETALIEYERITGLKVTRGGVILSDFSDIHMASPDGTVLTDPNYIVVVEVKCTQRIAKHSQRFFEGIDSSYISQCINYFAVSNDVKEVHFVSYCGYDDVRPLIIIKLKREDFTKDIEKGRIAIASIEKELSEKLNQYKSIEF